MFENARLYIASNIVLIPLDSNESASIIRGHVEVIEQEINSLADIHFLWLAPKSVGHQHPWTLVDLRKRAFHSRMEVGHWAALLCESADDAGVDIVKQ